MCLIRANYISLWNLQLMSIYLLLFANRNVFCNWIYCPVRYRLMYRQWSIYFRDLIFWYNREWQNREPYPYCHFFLTCFGNEVISMIIYQVRYDLGSGVPKISMGTRNSRALLSGYLWLVMRHISPSIDNVKSHHRDRGRLPIWWYRFRN